MKGTRYTCLDCEKKYNNFSHYEYGATRCPYCNEKLDRKYRFKDNLERAKSLVYYLIMITLAIGLSIYDNIWARVVGSAIGLALLIQVLIRIGPGFI